MATGFLPSPGPGNKEHVGTWGLDINSVDQEQLHHASGFALQWAKVSVEVRVG
jgi:hypothetical protein